ncbi:MAG: hypothetical protein SF187_10135 [Deltaproteobacteria bacterium]|nr:hypothetical protein [Deltaproteobacteria bacterium]
MTEPNANLKDVPAEMYDDYRAFIRQAVRDYYERGWKARKGNFIALVLASGQMAGLATDSMKDGSGFKKAAMGAAGVVALRLGLKYFLAGPLGLVLTAAMVASAIGFFVKNQKDITARVGPYRELIEQMRVRFEEIQGGYRGGKYDSAGRNLMIDGLMKQFIEQIDQ